MQSQTHTATSLPLGQLDDFAVLTDAEVGVYIKLSTSRIRSRRRDIKAGKAPASSLPPTLAIPDAHPRVLARDLKKWLIDRAEAKPLGRRPRSSTPAVV